MKGDEQLDESLEIGSKTWNRMVKAANTTGYREGVDEGSEAVLQEDFDRGYEDGFKMALALGKYKGMAAFALKDLHHPQEITSILDKTRRGACHICELESSKKSTSEDSEKIIKNHKEHGLKIINILQCYFKPLLENRGIDTSDLEF